jgi:hypothetical protein
MFVLVAVIMTAFAVPVQAKPTFSLLENPARGLTESFVLFDNPRGTKNAIRENPLTTSRVPNIGDLFPFNNKLYPAGTLVYGSVTPLLLMWAMTAEYAF